VECKDENGLTPLIHAAIHDCLPNIVELLDKGQADIKHSASDGSTALSKAHSPEVVMLLSKYGAEATQSHLIKFMELRNYSCWKIILNQCMSDVNSELLFFNFDIFQDPTIGRTNLDP
jgi:ankyrin repeat protein